MGSKKDTKDKKGIDTNENKSNSLKKEEISQKSLENPMKKTLSDKTRYTIIGVSTVLFLVLIIILIVVGEPNNGKAGKNDPNKIEERDTSTNTLKEFYEQFDSKEINVIFFESSQCGYCQLQAPIIKQISKDYNMEYYDIDASKLTEKEANEIISALGISGATPTTVIVQNGKVLTSNEGYLDGKPLVEFLSLNRAIENGATYKPEEKLVEIDYSKFKEISNEDNYQLVYLDTSACSACIEVRSILNDLAVENDFDVNYLSAEYLNEDEIQKLTQDDFKDMGYDEESYISAGEVSVPLLLIIKDNKIKNYVLESTEKSDYTKVLEKYGFID